MKRFLGSMTTATILACIACGFVNLGLGAENNAIVPVPKLENDFYDWNARHAQVLKVKDAINPEIVLIGDSITHLWGGEPAEPRKNGPKAWADVFGNKRVLNLGFGWDRTQNVLWRLDNGEFDGLKPKFVVLHIGTNNFSGTKNARESTPAEVAEGIAAICSRINAKSPETKIILMAVFPRGGSPKDGFRPKIAALNALLAPFAKEKGITFLDIGPKMLDADGNLPKDIMGDGVHPTEKGYAIWAAALKEVLAK
jgi:lysophospholipase L1-like esterase